MRRLVRASFVFVFFCHASLLVAAPETKGLRYVEGDRYRADITLDVTSTMQEKYSLASWRIGFDIIFSVLKEEEVIVGTTENVSVSASKNGEEVPGKQIRQMTSYFAQLELRFPIDQDGKVKIGMFSEDNIHPYKQALIRCLRPMLPAEQVKIGESWELNDNGRQSSNRRSGSQWSTGVQFSRGQYVGDVPLKYIRSGPRSPELKVAKLRYCAANVVDSQTLVVYWDRRNEKVLNSTLYRITSAGVQDRGVRSTKVFRISKAD